MPVAPTAKSARTNVYGRLPRGSDSPKSTRRSSSQPKAKAAASAAALAAALNPAARVPTAVARKGEENLYFEEDYSEEIIGYMTSMDSATVASAELMDMQPELQWFMRSYLIDFIIEVHQQFRLRPEVLYLAMNIVDRYISKRVVYKKHYQLVGCSALWIAAKFEDAKDKVPLVHELAEMCCKAYDESAFIQMEGHVLSTINWQIGHPSAEAWLRVYAMGVRGEEQKVGNMARFVMEITLFHREFIGVQSSVIAAAGVLLARYICGKPYKPCAIGVNEQLAARVAIAIDKRIVELEKVSEIVIRKYAPAHYDRVSTIAREWYLSGRRYAYSPIVPSTPVATGMSTPGLAPSGSGWSKRGSWVSSSPAGSCASSEAGDDAPLTPITPVHAHNVDPFASIASKENIAPGVYAAGGEAAKAGKPASRVFSAADASAVGKQQAQATVYPQRPPLHALPAVGELGVPSRAMRRLSN
ncbi:hypothetical protein IAT38_008395 [Cryptococcus sp. DSM 104549]